MTPTDAVIAALAIACYALGLLAALLAVALAAGPSDAPPREWWQRDDIAD